MMYGKNFLELLGPKVEKPMILEMDNKINMGIFNNWSITGTTSLASIWFAYI